MKKLAILFVVTAFAASVFAEQQGLPPEKPAAVSNAPEAEQSKKVEEESYIYSPKGRRDPFMSIIKAMIEAEKKKKKKKTVMPIEDFDVGEFKIVAIVWTDGKYYALVRLPDNKYYTLKEGTTLGLHGGKVVNITPEDVTVREVVRDLRGQMQSKDTILKLRKEEENEK